MKRSWVFIVMIAVLLALTVPDTFSSQKSRSSRKSRASVKKKSSSKSKRASAGKSSRSKRGVSARRSSSRRGSKVSRRTRRGRAVARSRRSRRRSTPRAASAPTVSRVPTERVIEIQNALVKAGYFEGAASGEYDETTIQAMKRFQTANGIQATGRPSAHALKLLGVSKRNSNGYAVPIKKTPASDKKKGDEQGDKAPN